MRLGFVDRAEIPRPAVVVEDDFLIEVGQLRHQPNTSRTRRQRRDRARRCPRACCRSPSEARIVAGDAVAIHHRLRAVLPGAHGHALAIENRPGIVRVHAVEHERQDAGLLPRLADDARARNLAHAARWRTRARRPRAPARPSRSIVVEIVDGRAEPDDAGDVRRAGLELVRHRRCTCVFSNVTDAIMSPPPWYGGIASSSDAPAVEHAGAGRAEHLVAREHVEIAVERLHVDRRGAAPPARRRSAPPRRARAPAAIISRDRIDRAERVRHVADGDDPASRSESSAAYASSSISPRSSIGTTRSTAPVCSHSICHGTMFEWCSSHDMSDLVARLQHRPAVALRDEIDAVGRAVGQDDRLRVRGVDEARGLRARALVQPAVARSLSRCVARWMLRVGVAIVVVHRLQHGLRLLARVRAVEIHERLAVHALPTGSGNPPGPSARRRLAGPA